MRDELELLFEKGRRRGGELIFGRLAEALLALGCLGFVGLGCALLAGFRPEPKFLLILPAWPLVVALLHGLAGRRTAAAFEELQRKLGQAPLGGYVRGQANAMTAALRVRYLPHGEHVFVRVRLDHDKESCLDYCAGPLLRPEELCPDLLGSFRWFSRLLAEDESTRLFELLRQPLETVPSSIKDGAPCQLVVDDGTREVFRSATNLSDPQTEQADVAVLARLMLALSEVDDGEEANDASE